MSAAVTVTKRGDKYVAQFKFSYEVKDLVKATGFRFDPASKSWWTGDPNIAAKLGSPDLAATLTADAATKRQAVVAAVAASAATDANIDVPVPEGLAYLPYQRAGIAYALARRATLFADAMGLGKSAEAIGTTVMSDGFPAVVICPASLKLNWRNEIQKFLPVEGWVLLLQGKPDPEISNYLSSFFALYTQVWQQGAQKQENVNHVVERDLIARLPRYIRMSFNADNRTIEIAGNKIHDALMGIIHRDTPSSRVGVLDDSALTIKEPSNVSQGHRISRHQQTGRALVSSDKAAGTTNVMSIKNSMSDAKLAGQISDGFAGSDAPNSSIDDLSSEFVPSRGIDGKATATQQIAQSGRAISDRSRDMGQTFAGIDPISQIRQNSGGQSSWRHLFLICNYDVLADWLPILSAAPAKTIIFDEIHYNKSRKAKRTGASMALAKAHTGARILGLSGTPILNRPAELIEPLKILGMFNQIAGSWKHFVTRYCAGHQTRYGWDVSGASHLDELQQRLRVNGMIRRLKEDVLPELPPKRRQIVVLEPDSAARDAIDAERRTWEERDERIADLSLAAELAKADDQAAYEAAVAALREGYRVAFTEIAAVRRAVAEAKLPQAIEVLEDALAASKKVVCFAHHHSVIDAVAEHFGTHCVKLDGRDSLDARQRAVDRFQSDPSVEVFIGQITAAGVGITLTAAAHVLFLEEDWVPGNVSQAEDRCHRIGQQDHVLVQHLVLDGSLDARMAQVLVDKQAVLDAALDRDVEIAAAPVFQNPPATANATHAGIAAEAQGMGREVIAAIHLGLQMLAGLCDGAAERDSMGFNKLDTRIGKSLAMQPHLTPRQAALGRTLVARYRRQLPTDLLAAAEVTAPSKRSAK